jgi:hypothetical protein
VTAPHPSPDEVSTRGILKLNVGRQADREHSDIFAAALQVFDGILLRFTHPAQLIGGAVGR